MQPEPNRSVYPTLPPKTEVLVAPHSVCQVCLENDMCVQIFPEHDIEETMITICPECWFIINKLASEKFSELIPSWKRWTEA